MKTKINLVLAFGMLLLVSLGCSVSEDGSRVSFTSANISDLKFGRNKGAKPASVTFAPRGDIYIVSRVNNTASKHKVQMVLFYEDVEGEEPDSIAGDFGMLDVPGEYSFNFSISPKGRKMPTGRYRVEAILFDEDGTTEIQRKEAAFEVSEDYDD